MSEVLLSADAEHAIEAASRRVEELVAASLEWRGGCSIAFSVRPEVVGLFDNLASAEELWTDVMITQVDDRLGKKPREWDALAERLMDPGSVADEHRFPLPVSVDDLDDELRRFTQRLDDTQGERFAFDIAQLVLDADGGIGALRPGAPILDSTKRVDVTIPKVRETRVGLTFASLQRSRTIVVIAVGEDKAEHVRHMADMDGRVPASQLRHHRVEVFADEAAAAFLDR